MSVELYDACKQLTRSTLLWGALFYFIMGDVSIALAQQDLESSDNSSAQNELKPGVLGIEMRSLSVQSVEKLNLRQPSAILVILALAGGAAEKAGIEPGDIILEIDGEFVPSLPGFAAAIKGRKVGGAVQLKILRNGSQFTTVVYLGSPDQLKFDPNKIDRYIAANQSISILFGREQFPEDWAITQSNIGHARLNQKGGRGAEAPMLNGQLRLTRPLLLYGPPIAPQKSGRRHKPTWGMHFGRGSKVTGQRILSRLSRRATPLFLS